MNMTSVFAEITKTAPLADGTVMVYGKATGSDLDLDGQRCDPAWLRTAMPEWFRTAGNVREQHDAKRAIGKAIEHDVVDGDHWIKAHIVDPVAVAKTRAGVFTGFSIGVKSPVVEKSNSAPNGLISGGNICEVSLVDRPALPSATFTMCKSAKPGMQIKASDFDSERMLVRVEEFVEKTVASDLQKQADSMTVTLADSLSPEQVEALASKVSGEPVEKATSVDNLDAPNPGQVCLSCGAGGHMVCGDNYADALKQLVEDRLPDTEFSIAATDDFDRDGAIALVNKAVANADEGLGEDESPDINGALQAITIIAGLIQREAQDLGTMPAQGCDIDLLMSAVHALRMFVCREAKEQAGIDPGVPLMLTADADLLKAEKEPYGDVEYADPGLQEDGKKRYPIDTAEHCRAALSYINKASNADKYSPEQLKSIKSKIIAACKKFGIAVDADAEKGVDVDDTVSVDEAEKTVAEDVAEESEVADEAAEVEVDEKADEASVEDEGGDSEKSAAPETTKAVTVESVDVEAVGKAVAAALEKAFSSEELEKAENPIRKTLGAIVSAASESVAKSVSDLSERLEMVEQMAAPGGPAQRRTEFENKAAKRTELLQKAAYWRQQSESTGDPDLRKGWALRANELLVQAEAVVA